MTVLAPRLTDTQRAALQLAVDAGGCFEVTGLDRRHVRWDVVQRLKGYGYLRFEAGESADTYHITLLGRKALQEAMR